MRTGNFDGIANKFDQNIYGTSKGRLRHDLLCYHLSSWLDAPAMNVADIGGGTGIMAREFASRGHFVNLSDVSSDVLTIAKERLSTYGNVSVTQQSLFDWQGKEERVICHAVLEWLEKPFDAIDFLLNKLTKGASLSLSFFNHHARLFNNALYGNFDYIAKGMKIRNQVRLNPHNPLKPEDVISHIENTKQAKIIHKAGIRCFHDYMFDRERRDTQMDELFALECEQGIKPPHMFLGKYFHLILVKK